MILFYPMDRDIVKYGNAMDKIQVGYWWRFSKYEIRDNVICPVSRAGIEQYDPWELFDNAREGGRRPPQGKRMMELPYQQLLALDQQIKNPFKYDAGTVTEWCSRFGLLGILPHCASSITLPARWVTTESTPADMIWRKFHRIQPDQLVPVSAQHVRTPVGWSSFREPFPPVRDFQGSSGMLLDERDIPARCPAPGVIWTNPTETRPSFESLDRLRPFFPGASVGSLEYPLPLSPVFWDLYGEPVHEFLNAARALHYSVRVIAHFGQKPLKELQEHDAALLLGAVEKLNALASPVSISLGPAENGAGLVQRWAGPSLLSSFAHMALLTLAEGLVRCCENCKNVFVTAAWQGAYCSVRCRSTALKRSTRERQKTAAAMHRAGKSIKTIAQRVGSKEETVRAWLKG